MVSVGESAARGRSHGRQAGVASAGRLVSVPAPALCITGVRARALGTEGPCRRRRWADNCPFNTNYGLVEQAPSSFARDAEAEGFSASCASNGESPLSV